MSYISVPVADLRKEGAEDSDLESQLLYGEPVRVLEQQGNWLRVEALEQARFQNNWTAYPGWIQRHQVKEIALPAHTNVSVNVPWAPVFDEKGTLLTTFSMGTRFTMLGVEGPWFKIRLMDGTIALIERTAIAFHNQISRDTLVDSARKLLGQPYLWGGKSAFRQEDSQLTSCDCSGLVSLVYRVHGKDIPRDAHDQFMHAKTVNPAELKPADLIFLALHDKPGRMNHVMLSLGGDAFIDANNTDKTTVESTARERFGRSFDELQSRSDKYCISYGQIL